MKKKIFIIAIALLVLIGLGVAYINIFVLPTKTKLFITRFLEQRLGRQVEIKTLRYIPLSTLLLSDTTIYQDKYATSPLLKIENVKFNFSLIPLLTKKNLISKLNINNLSIKDLKLNGSIKTSLSPDLSEPSKFTGVIKLVDFSLDTTFLPHPIERLNGVIDLKPDAVSLNNTYFYFNGDNYQLEANLQGLNEEPEISFSLKNDILASQGKFLLKNGYVQIEKLNTQVGNSSLDLIGDISNPGDPSLNLYGDSKLYLKDAGFFLGKEEKDLKLDGALDAAIFFKGKINRLEDSEFGFKLKSKKISIQDFVLNDFDVDLRMKDGLVTTPKLLSRLYNGILSGSISAEVFSRKSPYSIELSLQNADLATWAKEAKFGKKVAGTLSSRFLLQGSGKNINNLKGTGWLAITNGYLWEMPILGGVANILSMSNLRSIIFKEAAGNFSIGNRKINITDLIFYSDDVNLSVNGFIDFDTNLDLLITTNMTQDLIKDSSDMASIANILVQQAGQFLGRVRVTGTLKNPEYNLKLPDIAEPVQKIFKKEIGDLLKDILE